MTILDTNILIQILKNDKKTIEKVYSLNTSLAISNISAMELFYGAIDKKELKKLEKFVNIFEILYVDKEISKIATSLIKRYCKSHCLDIPDSLIAATALKYNSNLFTYNIKDFRYIENLKLSYNDDII